MGSEAGKAWTLSFVVPVFDEVEGVRLLWSALRRAGDQALGAGRVASWEGVIVDDGSRDGTSDLLDDIAATDPRCVVVRHGTNQGIGAALHSGFVASSGDVLVYTDADLPWDLGCLDSLLAPVLDRRVDLVAGRRIGRAREGWWRAAQSLAYNSAVRALFGLRVTDVNFACKVASRAALPASVRSQSGFFDAEWLIWASRSGLRVRQVPVEFVPRTSGTSSVDGSAAVDIVREMLRHRRSFRARPVDAATTT